MRWVFPDGVDSHFHKDNVAPDSRCATILTPKGAFLGEFMGQQCWMVPTFCANCAKRGPDTPEENMRAFTYLCNECVQKYGTELGTMVLPDQVFWAAIQVESLEKFGRELSHEELDVIAAADASPLATLIKAAG